MSIPNDSTPCVAFLEERCVSKGTAREVLGAIMTHVAPEERGRVLVFDRVESRPVELDVRGDYDEALARLIPASPAPRKRGRPKLGVVAREVTLLPRHWEWLGAQPGGASVALRKLVEEARKKNRGADEVRRAREACYRFMSTLAGNAPGFEEASRALFSGDREGFRQETAGWPRDLREHCDELAAASFTAE